MGKKTNKDILLDYVATLPDEKCREVYYLIQDLQEPSVDWVELDRVKLTRNQYTKLAWMWGEDKTKKCVEILNDWLKEKNITKNISCYHNLLGWVEVKYNSLYHISDKDIRFDSEFKSIGRAREYIKHIPKELRAYDREVRFLVEKFGKGVLDIKE